MLSDTPSLRIEILFFDCHDKAITSGISRDSAHFPTSAYLTQVHDPSRLMDCVKLGFVQ